MSVESDLNGGIRAKMGGSHQDHEVFTRQLEFIRTGEEGEDDVLFKVGRMVGLVEDGLGMVVGLGLFTMAKGVEGGLAVVRGATSLPVKLREILKGASVEDGTRGPMIDH